MINVKQKVITYNETWTYACYVLFLFRVFLDTYVIIFSLLSVQIRLSLISTVLSCQDCQSCPVHIVWMMCILIPKHYREGGMFSKH